MTPADKALALLGTWSRPPDFPAKAALAFAALLATLALFGRGRSLLFGLFEGAPPELQRTERRRVIAAFGMGAALLSIAYIASYLRGGPRIVDATTYFLQGRALSHGDFAWTPLDPSASFRGRFLLYAEGGPDGASLGGIFPPGYPLLLAFGFMLGAPMIVGPLLAMGLVAATYLLARALAEDTLPALAEPIARAAALLSLTCAALRYHTADTMSHGAAALGVTLALACAVRARQARARVAAGGGGGRGEAALAGLAVGYVIATRPASALPIALVVAWLLAPVVLAPAGRAVAGSIAGSAPGARSAATAIGGRRSRLLALALAGALPGLFLLLLSQRAVTGSWLESTQRVYYATSDGPPGCFRWGFGVGTGCLFEHGEFVAARLPGGYGIVEAAGTTLRRLHKHVLDVANLEPLALLVLVPALLGRRHASRGAVLPATALVVLQVLAYAPFYFDGDYPGGGARFFADVLPVEHALVMLGVASLLARAPASRASVSSVAPSERAFTRGAYAVLALAAAGFAVHGTYEHGKLRDRDGGRPMFEPDVLARASLSSGLVFVDTDHGFALGHDPAARPDTRVLVARLRNDDRDRMLFDALDRPPTWLYRIEPPVPPATESTATLTPWAPPEPGPALRFEAEAEWPPLAQAHGFAAPVWAGGCASGSRALVLTPEPGQTATTTIALPVPSAGRWAVEVHVVHGASVASAPGPARPTPESALEAAAGTLEVAGAAPAEGTLEVGGERWTWRPEAACAALAVKEVELTPPHARVTIEAANGPIGLDYISLRKVR
ncbi:MAG: hypothetical protein KF894_29985 [Labilithrix sp.]|nr:hypothetical protein [Labilithrix sp.]